MNTASLPSTEAEDAPAPSADSLRRMANGFFQAGDFDTALPLYSAAIDEAKRVSSRSEAESSDRNEDLVVHVCNRSACLFRMERFEE
mgnify:CR=1 FL=1